MRSSEYSPANPNAHRKMTPKGQMSNSGMGPAITHLPVHLKALFEPNAPLEFRPKIVKRKMPPYSGLATFADQVGCTFDIPCDTGTS